MDYNFETLGDERFQKLCQSILTTSYPNVQCLPVGQPDGGRDAFARDTKGGFVVFQVKYSRNPQIKDERLAITNVINSERPKVEALIERGATAFYLMTNVSGTSHLGVGSIDKVDAELTNAFGVPSFCWWRDDLERRLETTAGLIWRYPEIFRGSDFLEILASGKMISLSEIKTSTFRAYVSAQYLRDAEVRFQQVQIQNSLLDIFTDIPIGCAREKLPSSKECNVPEKFLAQVATTAQSRRYRQYDDDSETLAANWLLAAAPESGLQRIVLEGAPGQGKSTVTQYLAQIQRIRSLRKTADAEKIQGVHKTYTLRLPVRVDLRDYAAWLIGNDPFATERDVRRPPTRGEGLESFLSHQIHILSGNREFTTDDLASLFSGSHCLLVLDGFDEVADKLTRSRLIEQIRSGSERLGGDCLSLQVIVTSRPAAFILSPGFSENEWLHLSLLPMRIRQIGEYTDKWIVARKLSANEGREFKELLLDRVERSHIRSLAQNPMQLAILLSLISTKGRSLPDKRTSLYDSYMDLFFGREAEKDETVRENRDVLIQIHQYVAWTLQVDAEKPGGSGSISQADLEELVKKFLMDKEHVGDVLKLFTGAVERVGALVSRVQGMLEFEVQPLREYFTGRFLYETAPYSPAGAEKTGTRPQRFDALARRPYWLNVARFYAGCYNSGELSSLVSGLEQVEDGSDIALLSHSLQLAVLFLNDWVFAQEPKTVKDVVRFLSSERNLRLLIASPNSWGDDRLALPERSGRKELSVKAKEHFLRASEPAYLNRLGALLRLNMSLNERWTLWKDVREKGGSGFAQTSSLGLFLEVDGVRQRELIETYGDAARQAFISFGRWSTLDPSDRVAAMKAVVLRGPLSTFPQLDSRATDEENDLYRAYVMLHLDVYNLIHFDRKSDISFEGIMVRYGVFSPSHSKDEFVGSTEPSLFDVMSAAKRASRVSSTKWRTSLEPWTDFVESVRRTWGDGTQTYGLAAIAAGIISKDVRAAGFDSVFDQNLPLVERARFARLKPALSWWKRALADADTDSMKQWILILLLAWAPSAVIKGLGSRLRKALNELEEEPWADLIYTVRLVISSTREGRQPLSRFDESDLLAITSQRLKAIITLRAPRALAVRALIELLQTYDGRDQHLGAFLAARGLTEAQRDQKIWGSLISFHGKYGTSTLADVDSIEFNFRRNVNMPISIAREAVSMQTKLPLEILDLAQSTLSRRSGNTMNTLGKVSTDEKWFG